MIKVAGLDKTHHRGPARVFNCEEDAMQAVLNKQIKAGDVVKSATRARAADRACARCWV